ncbi:hypothetical protein DFP85_11341 [Halomonas ventosae]|uniref:Secreted protein n=1 Tax=Halomonas ventosae TaxID=229007 RepID=A0A4R6ZIU9_9GAMM|nr:hypothetical protein [Halomonas ventosae]TDR52261.1 hypothetical protein DFP85_11341 [Halomonas ventosae]
MKIRTVTLAMMTLILSAGSLMAMDSEYQEKRRQALQEKSASASIQADNSIEKRRSREVSQQGERRHREVDDEEKLTR